MKPIGKPKPAVLLLFAVVMCAAITSGFLYPIYVEMQNLLFANTEFGNASQAVLDGDLDIAEQKLQSIEARTGFRLFNEYGNVSKEELFTSIYAARKIIVQEWRNMFEFAVGIIIWIIILDALVAILVTIVLVYDTKGWRVRKKFTYSRD
jgi:hypothetical protein